MKKSEIELMNLTQKAHDKKEDVFNDLLEACKLALQTLNDCNYDGDRIEDIQRAINKAEGGQSNE